MSTNWGPHRFNDYFQKMESFVLSAAAFRGFTSLFDVYQEVTQLNDFALLNPLVKCPGFDLFKAFLTRHGQTPVSEYHILPQPTSMACLLHWRVILQLLVPLTSEQYRQLLAEHGGTPAQAAKRRISSEQAAQSEREQDETTQAKQISQVPVAPPRAESAAPESDSPSPQTARQLESSTSQPVPSGERRISLMQVDRPEGATGGTVAPVGRPKVSVAKPRTQAARVAPRPTLPPSSGPQHVNLVPRLMRTTVARPSVSVAVSARVRPSGAPGLVGAMGVAGPRQALPPQRSGPPHLCRPPVPLLLDLEPRGAITVLDPCYSAHPKQHRNYTRLDKTLSPQAYLVDSHFHLDKICVERGMETNNFDALFSPDTPGAHPSVRFPIKSVTCYMLSLKYDSAYSRKELMSFYKPFSTSPDVKLMFCVHPVHAADFKTPTKRVEAVDMCVDHLILPGTVAAGEFGLDYHRVQTAEGRTHSKEFLSLMVKKLVTDDRLKRLPLVLHVREARQTKEEAASKCIGTLRMASFPRDRKIYLHCFCGSTKVAHFWIGAYPHVKFGISPKNISGNQPSAEYFQSCDLKYLMLETDAPSLFFLESLAARMLIRGRPRHLSPHTRLLAGLHACEINQWVRCWRRLPTISRNSMADFRKPTFYVYAIQYIHMCADIVSCLCVLLCIRRAAAADTMMFIVLSYTSVLYVADAAIYLYHYCVLCFCVCSILYVADAAIYLHDLSFVCSLEPLAPLCAWWVTVHITLGFVFLGFLACAPYTNPVLVVLLFVSNCLTGWSADAL